MCSSAPKTAALLPRPMPTAMMPDCSMLEYASSRFRFHWIRMNGMRRALTAAQRQQKPPENSGPSAAFEIRWMRSRQYSARVQHADRHQHARRRRRFAVGIGLPRVHRRQARLRAVADEREHDAETKRERMQLGACAMRRVQWSAGHPSPSCPWPARRTGRFRAARTRGRGSPASGTSTRPRATCRGRGTPRETPTPASSTRRQST